MNKLLCVGALLGVISVIIGAMADHAFVLDDHAAQSVQTAIRYNMLYAALISALSVSPVSSRVRLSAIIFAVGTALFAGGIYAAYLAELAMAVYATPVGGVILILGWLSLLWAGITKSSQ